ncbi:hypothetical protein LTR62_005127 [Meristemomyces frigidus]|uniref:Uncharacterized protein n=1 Tax=Meristemomyces frigidus TaxID=1508187 RepID=A0AAN7THT6_9PEZI|nr:hypothetical protein LTR62_005127 [Meristemomyces frigidus]
MFLDDWIAYLNIHNASRITGLSIHDPFAIAGIIMLITLIPMALILLTVTARRSVDSIFDGHHHDRRIRLLQRGTRRLTTVGDLQREQERQSWLKTADAPKVHRASLLIPARRSRTPPGRIDLSERMPLWTKAAKTPKNKRCSIKGSPRPLSSWPVTPTFTPIPLDDPEVKVVPPYSIPRPRYVPWSPAPQLYVGILPNKMTRKWSKDFQQTLERTGRGLM